MAIEIESVKSLFIEMLFNETKLSSGTAFIVGEEGARLLITNRHNVTGRHQETGQPLSRTGGVPNKIRVWRPLAGQSGRWNCFDHLLYHDNEDKRWFEHPTMGPSADFIALKLDDPFDIATHTYDTATPDREILVRAADIVSVIGFPFGEAAGGLFGIWATGFVASEIDVNYNDKSQFLIDCRGRPGQSGSPVIAHRKGMVSFKNGDMGMGADHVEFLGIYSGRINEQSDLGIVWKRSAIDELVRAIQI